MTAESALTRLEALPGVADGIAAAREACTHLRWHPALRRRTEEARVEATIDQRHAVRRLSRARGYRSSWSGTPPAVRRRCRTMPSAGWCPGPFAR